MALNSNHLFEELEDKKCSIVEKNCTHERVIFLKNLLEYNGLEVVIAKSPPPKSALKTSAATPSPEVENIEPAVIVETYTVGVTDLSFNPTNAIYNRELKTKDGKIVLPNYWKQATAVNGDDSWYWTM